MMNREVKVEFDELDEDAWKRQEAADEASVQRLLSQQQESAQGEGNLFDHDRPFDQSQKADDAQDFEDISEDDLPDEEDGGDGGDASGAGAGGGLGGIFSFGEVPGLTDDGGTSHDTDDLFGEGRESSPLGAVVGDHDDSGNTLLLPTPSTSASQLALPMPLPASHADDSTVAADTPYAVPDSALSFREINFDPEPHFYGSTNQDLSIPAPAETVEDLIKQTWPQWKTGIILSWNELLPPKKATWIDKKASRAPKPLLPTKLSLELEADQEKLFRIPGTAQPTFSQRLNDLRARGLVSCLDHDDDADSDREEFGMDDEDDEEVVGGFTLRDIETVCDDWEAMIDPPSPVDEPQQDSVTVVDEEMDDWDKEFLDESTAPVTKKRKLFQPGLPEIARFVAPSFDYFDQATARHAKRVRLDLNDPYLLIDDMENDRVAKRPRTSQAVVRMANGKLGRDVYQRYNVSNDEAYEALKENHQSKVRATLGNLAVEHSLPALKLIWPYYRVKLVMTHARSFHRPGLQVRRYTHQKIRFNKMAVTKRKHLKGKKTQEIFGHSRDLTLNDNSNAVLFEYSEEVPTALSNFGMGMRVINYYRRKEGEDEKAPKLDLGETSILLPEDRSPFSIFGSVDTGETVPTFHNQMYRSPIFKHNPRPVDFIVGRSSTGVGGASWYVRNMDHLYVVGQTFPSVEIPGPHSRKVTNVAKNRVKMISYRIMRKNPQQHVTLPDVTRHIADSTDAQNRQKLKEFLHYNKEEKQWGMKAGDSLMDEAGIRSMIKPEDTCLIEAMQVGMQNLYDAGFDPKNTKFDDNDDEEDKADGTREEPLPKRMAPWRTTKAFIDACAGKAMVQLHGDGDPTGHGLGFSFLKTSMKGGYINAVQGPLATSADAIERERKANNGHLYNVKQQEQMYNQGIKQIWGLQKATLSDATVHEDADVQTTVDEDDRFNVASTPAAGGGAHRTGTAVPSASGAPPSQTPFEDGGSRVSGMTSASRAGKRRIRITRTRRNNAGDLETYEEVLEDPVVIQHYIKRRAELAAEKRDIYEIRPTGNADIDRQEQLRIEKELSRLERNKERRFAREKQKHLLKGGPSAGRHSAALHAAAAMADDDSTLVGGAGSPEAVGTVEKSTASATTRKCANCGMVGHIKTNKKLCPLLNGTAQRDNGVEEHGGFGNFSAPAMPGLSGNQ